MPHADESWTRKHSNEWIGSVTKISGGLGGRYVASATPPTVETRRGRDHATLELARTASDADVRDASGHHCSDACEPWHQG